MALYCSWHPWTWSHDSSAPANNEQVTKGSNEYSRTKYKLNIPKH